MRGVSRVALVVGLALHGCAAPAETHAPTTADAAQLQRAHARRATTQAWASFIEADAAARAGDCARVAQLDPWIYALDHAVHAVFTQDAAIARCLETPDVDAADAS